MNTKSKSRFPLWIRLLPLFAAIALVGASSPAHANWNPYWFSWTTSDCEINGAAIDPISTYFIGSGASGGHVRRSLIYHLGNLDSRWYEYTNESEGQYFKHYNGACIQSSISIANGAADEERMHSRGAQVASPPGPFVTGLTPHYELYRSDCGGHVIAYAGAPTKSGGHVRNGGYVYPRIQIEQAFGNGRRRAFPFHFYRRSDGRSRRQCTWTVRDGGTLVQIGYGD